MNSEGAGKPAQARRSIRWELQTKSRRSVPLDAFACTFQGSQTIPLLVKRFIYNSVKKSETTFLDSIRLFKMALIVMAKIPLKLSLCYKIALNSLQFSRKLPTSFKTICPLFIMQPSFNQSDWSIFENHEEYQMYKETFLDYSLNPFADPVTVL